LSGISTDCAAAPCASANTDAMPKTDALVVPERNAMRTRAP
jgi:hypothetical protein